jgi:hypothetical protein
MGRWTARRAGIRPALTTLNMVMFTFETPVSVFRNASGVLKRMVRQRFSAPRLRLALTSNLCSQLHDAS